MFRDCKGAELALGDPVTVERSSRRSLVMGSHGTIEKFGTKLVHVRLTWARTYLDDDCVHGFDPHELRKGHHGRSRHPEGFGGEMREIATKFKLESLDSLIALAVDREVITAEQGEAMKGLYNDLP